MLSVELDGGIARALWFFHSGWISEKQSELDIFSSNLICVNLADFTSWQAQV
jgi:hypothetical protein